MAKRLVIISHTAHFFENNKYITCSIQLHNKAEIEKIRGISVKLSPSLLAVKDSGGELKSLSIEQNKVVIVFLSKNLDKLIKSDAFENIEKSTKLYYTPIGELKLSYKDNLSKEEIKSMGLNVVEDYSRGQFMIVSPIKGIINADLIEKIEKNPKIVFTTVNTNVKAIQ